MAEENSLALTALNPRISTHLSCVLRDSRKISVKTPFSKTLTDEAGWSLLRPSNIWRHSNGPRAKFCFLRDARVEFGEVTSSHCVGKKYRTFIKTTKK